MFWISEYVSHSYFYLNFINTCEKSIIHILGEKWKWEKTAGWFALGHKTRKDWSQKSAQIFFHLVPTYPKTMHSWLLFYSELLVRPTGWNFLSCLCMECFSGCNILSSTIRTIPGQQKKGSPLTLNTCT